MFAQLGDMVFELSKPFTNISSTRTFSFAEHKTISGKPKLENTGKELEEIRITVKFNFEFCIPEEERKNLLDMAQKQEALSFVYGNGIYKGKYVITELNEQTVKTDGKGNILMCEYQITLKEWVEDIILVTKKEPETNDLEVKKDDQPQVVQDLGPYGIVRMIPPDQGLS